VHDGAPPVAEIIPRLPGRNVHMPLESARLRDLSLFLPQLNFRKAILRSGFIWQQINFAGALIPVYVSSIRSSLPCYSAHDQPRS